MKLTNVKATRVKTAEPASTCWPSSSASARTTMSACSARPYASSPATTSRASTARSAKTKRVSAPRPPPRILTFFFISDADTGNNFTCSCSEGYVGPICDTAFCLREHCESGYCNTTGATPYCQCQRGFEGKFCEVNTDDCKLPSGNPCQNGGTCIDGINRYDCNCTGTGKN